MKILLIKAPCMLPVSANKLSKKNESQSRAVKVFLYFAFFLCFMSEIIYQSILFFLVYAIGVVWYVGFGRGQEFVFCIERSP